MRLKIIGEMLRRGEWHCSCQMYTTHTTCTTVYLTIYLSRYLHLCPLGWKLFKIDADHQFVGISLFFLPFWAFRISFHLLTHSLTFLQHASKHRALQLWKLPAQSRRSAVICFFFLSFVYYTVCCSSFLTLCSMCCYRSWLDQSSQ